MPGSDIGKEVKIEEGQLRPLQYGKKMIYFEYNYF
jgi:hypothetical protein